MGVNALLHRDEFGASCLSYAFSHARGWIDRGVTFAASHSAVVALGRLQAHRSLRSGASARTSYDLLKLG